MTHDDEIVVAYLPGPRRRARLRYHQAAPVTGEPWWRFVAEIVGALIVFGTALGVVALAALR